MDLLRTSSTRATVGRVVHVYSTMWDGARYGLVAGMAPSPFGGSDGAPCDPEGLQLVNVNVGLDGTCDEAPLLGARCSPLGATRPSLPLFDVLTSEQRAGLVEQAKAAGRESVSWAEWPPR